MALLAVSIAAIALALLPAAVGAIILIGSTVALEFAAAAGLTLLASIKIAATVAGLVAAHGGTVSTRLRTSPLSRFLALSAQRR
ncbi:MAG: hypothetical protein E6I73_05910 [Chloroflexi bacterium]|nr:MAG: hypothetical protein E6I73_05910 [Chloroflexota bacterium]